MAKRKALGKGLMALIDDNIKETITEKKVSNNKTFSNKIQEISLSLILPNEDQPRKDFSDIDELVNSIKEKGILQPILVRFKNGKYQIIAGERRYRAALKLNLKKIPAIQLDANEEETLEFALIENIQRKNLNPIEEAEGYKLLIERFHLKQEDVAKKVGKDRSTITNLLRLLNLPDEIKKDLASSKISLGHAKILLGMKNKEEQIKLKNKIIEEGLSVRATEKILGNDKKDVNKSKNKTQKSKYQKDIFLKNLENKLEEFFSTKVRIIGTHQKGKIEIDYYSMDDLERIKDIVD